MDLWDVVRLMEEVWEKWDVRGLMLLSLSLQTSLVLLAPLRKRTSNKWVIGTLLCLYLLADWAANFASGVITSSKSDKKNGQPLAFWSTFLLVHLGGPDSITAFAMQDNDFWHRHRHALALVFQCISAAYIFFQTLAQNQLWIPTLLMFVCGFIKYYERTRSLYSASLKNLRDSMRKKPNPGPNYLGMMDVFRSKREGALPTRIDMIDAPRGAAKVKRGRLERKEVVPYAHLFFKTFKHFVVDLKCSYRERIQSREFFFGRTSEEALKVIAVELNFMYDILFAKASVVYNRRGFLLRSVSFALVVTSFGLFYFEKKRFRTSDVSITYALLLGAIALDVIAVTQFITSDWLTTFTRKLPAHPSLVEYLNADDHEAAEKPCLCLNWKLPRLLRRKWCESVSTHNLIDYCLSPRRPERQKIMDCFGLTPYFDGLEYVRRKPFTRELWDHIFEELSVKSRFAEDPETIRETSAARGDWALRVELGCRKLLPYIHDMDYDQSLLAWHIATKLCWCKEVGPEQQQKQKKQNNKNNNDDYRDFAKLLSDYMMYLVTMQPELMYGVTDIGLTRVRDTCAEVRKTYDPYQQRKEDPSAIRVILYALRCSYRCLYLFIIGLLSPILSIILSLFVIIIRPLITRQELDKLERNRYCSTVLHLFSEEEEKKKERSDRQVEYCRKILGVNTFVDPVCAKEGRSKTVLFDGCRLAKELMKLEGRKWEVMSKVWVEMLSYAAVRCRPQAHAQQLSKGGELISFVWLLVAHFGLVDHFFEVHDGHSRAKLIVGK